MTGKRFVLPDRSFGGNKIRIAETVTFMNDMANYTFWQWMTPDGAFRNGIHTASSYYTKKAGAIGQINGSAAKAQSPARGRYNPFEESFYIHL
jgi:hypothetical protein